MDLQEGEPYLIERAKAGDKEAITQLLVTYHDRIAAHIRQSLPTDLQSTMDTEDIQQQTYMQACQDILRFEPGASLSFYPWLKAIARNRLNDAIRKKRALKRGGEYRQVVNTPATTSTASVSLLIEKLKGDDLTPSSKVARDEAILALQSKLMTLTEEQRKVTELFWNKGLSEEEIAQQTGRTKSAVRGLLYRLKKELRKAMGSSSRYMSDR